MFNAWISPGTKTLSHMEKTPINKYRSTYVILDSVNSGLAPSIKADKVILD